MGTGSEHCRQRGPEDRLDASEVHARLHDLAPWWQLIDDGAAIEARFEFSDFRELTLFLHALAWISHTEDHHPEVRFVYRDCTLIYSTHSAGGLTQNDFICARQVDALYRQYQETLGAR